MTGTHPGAPRDVDLADWLRSVGYHAPDTRLKQLGHEAVRALIGDLGVKLHYIVAPGADKSVMFRKLREVMFYANAQLATAGGPSVDQVTEGSLRGMLEDLLGDAVRPADPRPEFAVPDDPDEASAWLDRANDAVNAKHPSTGYQPSPATDAAALEARLVDVLRATLGEHYEIASHAYHGAAGAVLEALWSTQEPPAGGLAGLTPAAADVTPATEAGGIADTAPDDSRPHTIWGMNPLRKVDDTDLGVTAEPGIVSLVILGGPAARLVHSPGTANSGYGVAVRSLDAVNMILETIAAAAGRAFSGE